VQSLYLGDKTTYGQIGPEHLLLAARSQHIQRWKIPRDAYPIDRLGYLKWRATLKEYHSKISTNILFETGYDQPTIEKVRNLILKKNFPNDSESRVLEDALCIVFLKFQLLPFSMKTSDEKTINALKKSWSKMTEHGRKEALNFDYDVKSKSLIEKALSDI